MYGALCDEAARAQCGGCCLGSYSTGVSKQLLPSFIKTHHELSCNGELIFFDDRCIPVKIKVCLKAALKRTEVRTY